MNTWWRFVGAVSSRYEPNTYRGSLKALVPLDLTLSLLAKRSYTAYRLWSAYADLTGPLFDRAGGPPLATEDGALLGDLQRDGYAFAASRLPADEVRHTRGYLLSLYEEAHSHARRYPTQTDLSWTERGITFQVLRSCGRTRFHFSAESLAHAETPGLLRRFARDERVAALLGAYFEIGEVLPGLPYFMAEVMDTSATLESWHVDCLRETVKVYLSLDDMGEGKGPVRYLPGSHRIDEARHHLFHEIARGGLGPAYFDKHECAALDRAGVPITVPFNTLILFDTRGFHAGSLCRTDRRIILANGYRPVTATRLNPRLFRDPAPALYPWQRRPHDWQAT